MGFLDRFRRKYRRVEDPTFGELTYEPPWWRGKVLFRPCSSEVAIDVRQDSGIELGYSFDRDVGWDDAMFNVAIEGWTPRPVSLDD